MNTERCDYCVKLIQHMNYLLEELKKYGGETTLLELRCYYWLASVYQNIINECMCQGKVSLENLIYLFKKTLDNSHIKLNEESRKCDICKILPCEIFSLLDLACRMDKESLNTMYEELQYHVFLAFLYDEKIGRCTECDCAVEYIFNLEKTCDFLFYKDLKRLQKYVYGWKIATNTDEILSQTVKLRIDTPFLSKEITVNNRTTIYLDFNVYGKYENDSKVKSFLEQIVKSDDEIIFCSPVHLEELIRMNNSIYESQRLDSLEKLTKGKSIVVNNEELVFCTEDLGGRLKQVRKYSELNNFAEERNCIQSESREQLFDMFRNEASSKYIGTSTLIDMVNNIDSETGKQINANLPNELDINDILRYVGSNNYSIREYHDLLKSGDLTYYIIRTAIASISAVFNVLGFHADKIMRKNDSSAKYPIYHKDNYRTIRSGYYDNDHLTFATKCTYFVTTDEKLCARARELYCYMGCDTRPILLKDFIKLDVFNKYLV